MHVLTWHATLQTSFIYEMAVCFHRFYNIETKQMWNGTETTFNGQINN